MKFNGTERYVATDELKLAVRKAAAVRVSNQTRLADPGDTPGRFRIIGQSSRMQDIFAIIEKVAATPSTVLLTGESGTGKELVARTIHAQGGRAECPYCGAQYRLID